MKKIVLAVFVQTLFFMATASNGDIRVGQTLLRQRNYSEAREEFQKALAGIEGQEAVRVQQLIASTYNREGNFPEAVKEYEKVVQMEGANPNQKALALLEIGRILWREIRNYEEALQAFAKVLDIEEANAEYIARGHSGMATVYWAERKYDETIDSAKKALEIEEAGGTTRTMSMLYVARAQRAKNNNSEALEYYTMFINLDSRANYVAEAQVAVGEIYVEEGKYKEAREKLAKVIPNESAPSHRRSLAHFLTARSYMEEGNNSEALREFKELVESDYVSAHNKRDAERFINQLQEE